LKSFVKLENCKRSKNNQSHRQKPNSGNQVTHIETLDKIMGHFCALVCVLAGGIRGGSMDMLPIELVCILNFGPNNKVLVAAATTTNGFPVTHGLSKWTTSVQKHLL